VHLRRDGPVPLDGYPQPARLRALGPETPLYAPATSIPPLAAAIIYYAPLSTHAVEIPRAAEPLRAAVNGCWC